MDPQETKTLLEQAAALIREEKKKSARSLLLQILRADEGNVQAWYMLSFTVPDPDMQISALQQALRLKPSSQKILDRLTNLGGTPLPEPQPPKTGDRAEPLIPGQNLNVEVEPEKAKVPPPPAISDDELLSRRLFGGGDEEEELTAIIPSEEEPEPIIDPVEAVRSAEPVTGISGEPIDFPTEEVPAPRKRYRKVFGLRRNYFLLGILILIFLFLWLLGGLTDQDGVIRSAGNDNPATTGQVTQPPAEPSSTVAPTDAPTSTPPSPTETPVVTPTQPLFSFAGMQPPSSETLPLIAQYQDEIQTLIGQSSDAKFQTYLISEQSLHELIRDFSKLAHFEEQVQAASDFYQLLDIASGSEDFESFYQNYWADPNGTLLIPGKNTVTVVGFEFSDFQQYSFGQAYIQLLRQNQVAPTPFYDPTIPCYRPTEECLIQTAIIKGEAAFSAERWANQYFDVESLARVNQSNRKYFFTPIVPAPTDLMSLLSEIPYQAGYNLSEAVYNQAGWTGLEGLYLNPPVTTEQLLHSEKYLGRELPEPVGYTDLTPILPGDWAVRFQGELGEWNTYLLLAYNLTPISRIPEEKAREAAAGWNGDYAQAFMSSDGETILVIHWNWDRDQDAVEFQTALTDYSIRRTSNETIEILGHSCHINGNLTSCPITTGTETVWILAPSQANAELILQNYEALNTP